jgi:hypothetical protein
MERQDGVEGDGMASPGSALVFGFVVAWAGGVALVFGPLADRSTRSIEAPPAVGPRPLGDVVAGEALRCEHFVPLRGAPEQPASLKGVRRDTEEIRKSAIKGKRKHGSTPLGHRIQGLTTAEPSQNQG